MQMLASFDSLQVTRDALVAATLLAALASCAPPALAPAKRSSFALAAVQTDFLMIGNDKGLSCNFTVKELAAGPEYTRELHLMTVTIGAGRRLGPGQIGVVVTLIRADTESINDPWALVWPVVINTIQFGSNRYTGPDRWPGQPGVEAASTSTWTLPRSPAVARGVIEALDTGQVAISYTTLGSSYYARLGPTALRRGSKPQAFNWTAPVLASAADRANLGQLQSCANRLVVDSAPFRLPVGHT